EFVAVPGLQRSAKGRCAAPGTHALLRRPQVTIPQTNFNPPFNITRASHLVLTARDLAASRDFYVEVMGLIVSDENADTIWLRGVEERCHHSLTLKRTTGQPLCERIGFRVFTDEDIE